MSLAMSRHGKELDDDPEYQRRLASGEVQPPAPPAEIELLPYAKRSVAIFLAGVLAICVFGFFDSSGRRSLPRAAAPSRSRSPRSS